MVLCAKAAPGTAKAKEKKKKRQKTAGWSVARGNGVEVEDRGRRGRAVGGCSGKGGGNPLSLSGGGGLRAGISDFGREGRAHCLRSALGRGLRATLTGAPHSGISETYWRAKGGLPFVPFSEPGRPWLRCGGTARQPEIPLSANPTSQSATRSSVPASELLSVVYVTRPARKKKISIVDRPWGLHAGCVHDARFSERLHQALS